MSKMDDLRRLREARYEQSVARAAGAGGRRPATTARPASTTAQRPVTRGSVPVEASEAAAGEPEVALCGHRAISGRTCTREHGHAAKSHRYS